MIGQAPGGDGLEEVIVEREVLRVCPIVWDLSSIVVAHHVGRRALSAERRLRVCAAPRAVLRGRDETVHLAAIDIHGCRGGSVVCAAVDISGIVVWSLARLP